MATAANTDVARVSDALEAAARKLNQEGGGEINSLALSTGVVLEINRISPMIFQEVEERYPDPAVPKIYDEQRGRELENPMHPAYLEEKKHVLTQKSLAIMDAIAVLGTKLLSIPEGFEGPDTDSWKEKMYVLGYDDKLIERKLTRYLAWLKMVGAPDIDADWNMISMAVLRKTGVAEEDVEKAIASFRDKGEGQTDSGSETQV